jgi:hypothetical protein
MNMPEAEVSLRLAFWLLRHRLVKEVVEVAIDGAQVKVLDTVHFDLTAFMATCGWGKGASDGPWQCEWRNPTESSVIRIHSNPGRGDVVARLASGQTLRAECKKGPMDRSKSSAEYPLLREGLGQLLTVAEVAEADLLAVAVPHSAKFQELAERWRRAPLISKFGIQILTVDRLGNVFGFPGYAGDLLI